MLRLVIGSGWMDGPSGLSPKPGWAAWFRTPDTWATAPQVTARVLGATGVWYWGDGTSTADTGNFFDPIPVHVYSTAGRYTVSYVPDSPPSMGVGLYLPAMSGQAEVLDISGVAGLTTLSVPGNPLTVMDISSSAATLTTVDASSCRLTASTVDQILLLLAAGTTLSGVLHLGGQTPAAPPGVLGSLAVLVLVARGWAVITD